MPETGRQPASPWRHVFWTLAALALALKVLIPPGFMAAASNDLPFAIVLCTSQGAVTVAPGEALPDDVGQHEAPGAGAHDAPCLFAGHAAAAPPPAAGDLALAAAFSYAAAVSPTPEGLAPGRGLTGPPLPARGPPSLLI